jgi:hypothetical protein
LVAITGASARFSKHYVGDMAVGIIGDRYRLGTLVGERTYQEVVVRKDSRFLGTVENLI